MRKSFVAATAFSLVASFFPGGFVNAAVPVIQGAPYATNMIGPGAQIKWTTDLPSDSHVFYGTQNTPTSFPYYSSDRCDGGGMVSSHCVNLTGLSSGTTYYFKVKSSSADGSTEGSGYQFVSAYRDGGGSTTTPQSGMPPAAPGNLYAALSSSGSDANVTWADYSMDETAFKVYSRQQGGAWAYLSQTGSNVTSFTYFNLPQGVTYEFKVNSCNSYGCSGDSNIATITRPATGGPPGMPAWFSAAASGAATINLSWGESGGASSYQIYRRKMNEVFSQSPAYTFASSITSYADSALAPSTAYVYELAACNSTGCSGRVPASTTTGGSSGGGTSTTTTNMPDLTVFDIYDDGGRLSVRIGNIGSAQAPSGTGHLYIWIDNQLSWTYSFSTLSNQSFLSPGGTSVVQPQTLSGSHFIKAMIDANYTISESNENNNAFEKTLSFGSATTTPTSTPGAPAAPTGLSGALAANGTDAVLSWGDASTNESEFKVYWRAAGGTWAYLSSVGPNIATFTYYGHPAGTYDYYVSACNSSGCSAYSNIVSVSRAQPEGIPLSPKNFTAAVQGSNAIVISWQDASNETSYQVYRRLGTESIPGSPTFTFGQNVTTYTESGLSPGTTYWYELAACNSYGCSARTYASATVGGSGGAGAGSVPTAPTGVAASLMPNGVDISITWNDASANETGFTVYRRFSGSSWTWAGGADANKTSYTNYGVSAAGTYDYYVSACNSYGCSAPSPTATVKIGGGADVAPPAGIWNLAVTSIASSSARLTWTAPGDDGMSGLATSYSLKYSSAGPVTDANWTGANPYTASVPSPAAPGTTQDVFIYGLVPNTTYWFALRTLDDASNYSMSNSPSGTTPGSSAGGDTAPPSLFSIRTENVFGSGAQVRWSTNKASDSRVVFGAAKGSMPNFSDSRCDAGGNVTEHCVNVTGLTPRTMYYYRAISSDPSGNKGESGEMSFMSGSGSPGDKATSTPSVQLFYPNGGECFAPGSVITIKWTQNAAVNHIALYESPSGYGTRPPYGKWLYMSSPAESSYTRTLPATESSQMALWIVAHDQSHGEAAMDMSDGYFSISSRCGGTATSTQDTIAPSIAKFGYYMEADGRLRAGVSFSEAVDFSQMTDAAVYIADSKGMRIPGTLNRYAPSGLDYVTNAPANFDEDHYLVVKRDVRDLAGNQLTADYASPKFRRERPKAVEVPFDVDSGASYPRDGEKGVDPFATIRVKFTRPYSPASTVGQFFSLAPSANPSASVRGSFQMFSEAFEFRPARPLQPNTAYIYQIFTTLKDENNAPLANSYRAAFTTGGNEKKSGGVIEGTVRDSAEKPVAGAGIHLGSSDFSSSFGAMTDATGAFRLEAPKGTYFVEVYPPYDKRNLLKPKPMEVSIEGGETKTIILRFAEGAKTISGAVSFSNKQPVTDAEVGAYNSATGQWSSAFTDQSGAYALRVSSGDWTVGIHPKDSANAKWKWEGSLQKASFKADAASEAKVVDFIIPLANSGVVAIAEDERGVPITGAGVVLDDVASNAAPAGERRSPEFRRSDAGGRAAFTVAPGKYYIRAFLPPGKGYLNPEEAAVEVKGGEEREVRLVFRRPEAVQKAAVSGVVKLEDGTPVDASLWGWSEKGQFIQMQANAKGEFSFSMPTGDRVHIGAGKEVAGYPYKSDQIIVDVKSASVSIEIELRKAGSAPLPSPVSVTKTAEDQIVAKAKGGASISVPPRAAVSGGDVNVQVSATMEAPSQAGARVVGTVYDIKIRDQAGNEVKQLQEEVTIELPYSKDDLKAQGVTEDTIAPSYFDDATGVWVKVSSYSIDKTRSVIIARVKHLTRFAIVAAADVTPPEAPASVKAVAQGQGIVALSWTNPTEDFERAKVYRSTLAGTLGGVVASAVSGAAYQDSGVQNGIAYYYTVRAVDPAGNESANTAQVSVIAVGTSAKAKVPSVTGVAAAKGVLARNLSARSAGEDVKRLQQVLVNEGVYPEALITGYFGNLTRQAVIRFQEKYAADILAPNGLSAGNGFVGTSTRAKLNALIGK